MLRMSNGKFNRSKKAFTLVEMIVVLLVIAVIAAALIPALTGYIKRARRERYCENAHYALLAAQSIMQEQYFRPTAGVSVSTDGYNVDWRNGAGKELGNEVLELMDCGRGKNAGEPYILVFGTGNPESQSLSESDKYTIYYIAYVADENSPAVFYVNGEWMYTYPRGDSRDYPITTGTEGYRNTIVNGDHEIPLQFYIVSNRTGRSDTQFWRGTARNTLEGHCAGNNGF